MKHPTKELFGTIVGKDYLTEQLWVRWDGTQVPELLFL